MRDIAETVREFEGYVAATENEVPNEHEEEDEDGEDGEDDFNEEVRYSTDEVPLVKRSLLLMTQSLHATKQGLQVLTTVGDALGSVCVASTIDGVDFEVALRSLSIGGVLHTDSKSTSTSSASLSSQDSEGEGNCVYTTSSALIDRFTADRTGLMLWIGEMVRVRKHLLDALTDLGCELYPPVDASDVSQLHKTTQHYSKLLLTLLRHSPFQAFLTEDIKVKLAETCAALQSASI